MYPTTEEELQDYFHVAMAACEAHPHESELMELLVSQCSDLSTDINNANTSRYTTASGLGNKVSSTGYPETSSSNQET